MGRRRPGQRAGLTESEVRRHARQMLVEAGARGLTIRGLAERLGVTPNAIYSYTDDKLSLIDAVLDDVLAEVEEPGLDLEPADALMAVMGSTYDVLTRHRQLVPLFVERQGARGPNARRLGDVVLDLLAQADVTGAAAARASHVLVVHTIGAAAYSVGAPGAGDARAADVEAADAGAFTDGLRWLLRGIGLEPIQ